MYSSDDTYSTDDIAGPFAALTDPDAAIGAPVAGRTSAVGARAFLLLGMAAGAVVAVTAFPTGEWTTVSVI